MARLMTRTESAVYALRTVADFAECDAVRRMARGALRMSERPPRAGVDVLGYACDLVRVALETGLRKTSQPIDYSLRCMLRDMTAGEVAGG